MSINRTTYQLNIFTGKPEIAGDVVDRIRYLLRTHRDARNDYKVLIARYWLQFDSLPNVLLANDFVTAFIDWMQHSATSATTLLNRCMEIQSAEPDLDADPEVRTRRRRQATQGPVRR